MRYRKGDGINITILKGEKFYFNTKTFYCSWTKPKKLEHSEINTLCDYSLLINEIGIYYYLYMLSPWFSVNPPNLIPLCQKCNQDFPGIICHDCHLLYCFECFIFSHVNNAS